MNVIRDCPKIKQNRRLQILSNIIIILYILVISYIYKLKNSFLIQRLMSNIILEIKFNTI